MSALLITEVLLLLSVGIGWLAGHWLSKRYRRPAAEDSGPEAASGEQTSGDASADVPDERTSRLTDTIAFVGGAYGILLGLLLVFAVQHFVDARQASREEAVSAAALFTSLDPYPADVREPLRHDLVCYMRALGTDDWAAAQQGDLTGSENANAYAQLVQVGVQELPQEEPIEASNHFFVTDSLIQLVEDRQLRLLYAAPEIPPVIWLVLYIAAMVFTGLTVFHLGARTSLARVAVAASTLVLVVIIGSLTMLDRPYVGWGSALEPIALEGSLNRLRDAYPNPEYWAPCERLADEANDPVANPW